MAGFEALAAYANMGDGQEDWKKFRLMYPSFFPTNPTGLSQKGFGSFSEWIYHFAQEWKEHFSDLPAHLRPLPPLLWYRNRLRQVWSSDDRYGFNLAVLLGFGDEAKKLAADHSDELSYELLAKHPTPADLTNPKRWVPGTSGLPAPTLTQNVSGFAQLTQGVPQVDGLTGKILWKFEFQFQQSLYELMQCRWRAKVCPDCGRYFVATRNAQAFCSAKCTETMKRKRALAYWNEKGKNRRARAKARTK